MRTLSPLLRPALLGLVVLLAACDRPRDWNELAATREAAEGKKLVLVALADIGPLRSFYPGGRHTIAEEVVRELQYKSDDVAAFVARNLPGSESEAWTRGAVEGARAANLIVLVTVEDVHAEDRLGTRGDPQRIYSRVVMRVLRPDGTVLRALAHDGEARNVYQPKRMTAAAKPEAQATFKAVYKGCRDLEAFIDRLTQAELSVRPATVIEPKPVDVEARIVSSPPGAKIWIDGWFRGVTPTTVPLPSRQLSLKLTKTGYHDVEQIITPTKGMQPLEALLTPLPGTEVEKKPPVAPPPGVLPPLKEDGDSGKDTAGDAGKDAAEDPGQDAGKDAAEDAGKDAGEDATEDATEDAGTDGD